MPGEMKMHEDEGVFDPDGGRPPNDEESILRAYD